ncbi:MAG: hypothetical protein AB1796_05880 [Bacillota bacterium]
MLENGLEECSCPKKECERHGLCEVCRDYHAQQQGLPFCKREVKG